MKMKTWHAVLWVQLFCVAWAQAGERNPELERLEMKNRSMNSPERAMAHPVKEAVERIADRLKPGVTVLDIGAGQGDFAFEFAKRLRENGQVYATDVHPLMITRMKEKMRQENVSNLVPVQVQPAGLDPFYRSKSFDLVMASRVYHGIVEPISYFKELRASLKPDARVFLIETRMDSDFSMQTFFEFEKKIENLRKEGDRSLFFARFSPELKKKLRESGGKPVSEELKRATLAEVNRLLEDRTLFGDIRARFFEKSSASRKLGPEPAAYGKFAIPFTRFWDEHFTSSERQLALWLVGKLESIGAFDPGATLEPDDLRDLRFLNKMLIHGAFVPRILENPAFRRQAYYFTPREALIRNMERAGYQFVSELPYTPHFHFLEFKAP